MAKVKIIREGDETELDAHIQLTKALDIQNSGDAHIRESFDDAAMVDLSNKLDNVHNKIYLDMINEINDALDEEY